MLTGVRLAEVTLDLLGRLDHMIQRQGRRSALRSAVSRSCPGVILGWPIARALSPVPLGETVADRGKVPL